MDYNGANSLIPNLVELWDFNSLLGYGMQQPIKSATKFLFLNNILMEAVLLFIGVIIRAFQIMATIVCFKATSPKWLKICWGIGTILFMIAFLWAN